jgi:hypothetical protein
MFWPILGLKKAALCWRRKTCPKTSRFGSGKDNDDDDDDDDDEDDDDTIVLIALTAIKKGEALTLATDVEAEGEGG